MRDAMIALITAIVCGVMVLSFDPALFLAALTGIVPSNYLQLKTLETSGSWRVQGSRKRFRVRHRFSVLKLSGRKMMSR